jgi:Ca-activated chloride channel family protein
MSFEWPVALLGLLVLPLAVVLYGLGQRRRARYAVRFTNLDLLADVVTKTPGWRRHLPPALFLLALGLLLLGLAKPQAIVPVTKEEARVVLVMDSSESMRATDVFPDRITAAREAAEAFLDRSPAHLDVGLVTFSSEPTRMLSPTDDRGMVRQLLGLLNPAGGTAMGDALLRAVEMGRSVGAPTHESIPESAPQQDPAPGASLPKEENPTAVILLSDGANSAGEATPLEAAQEAKEHGIPVYTVALGTKEGVVEQSDGGHMPVPPDTETLRRIAKTTGGKFFASSSADDLMRVYEDLGSSLAFVKEKREITLAFVGAALALLAASGTLSVLWFNRLP